MNRRRIVALCLALGLTLPSCGGPRLPQELSVAGKTLKKGSEWHLEGVQGVVFIPEGESMRDAALQVGILTSTEHKTARELNVWIMRQYRLAQVTRWHESVSTDTACKIGQSRLPFREFAAVHVCRDGKGMAVCVEADGLLIMALQAAGAHDPPEWDLVCGAQWDAYRVDIEAIAEALGVSVPTVRRCFARARERIALLAGRDPMLVDYASKLQSGAAP